MANSSFSEQNNWTHPLQKAQAIAAELPGIEATAQFLRESQSELNGELDREMERLRADIRATQAREQNHISELEVVREKQTDLHRDFAQTDQTSQRVMDLEIQFRLLEDQIANSQNEIQEMQTLAASYEEVQQEVTSITEERDDLRREVRELAEEVAETEATNQRIIAELRTQNAEEHTQRTEAIRQLQMTIEQCDTLQQRVKTLEHRLQITVIEHAEVTEKMQTEGEDLLQTISELNQEINRLGNETMRRHEAEGLAKELRDQRDHATQELETLKSSFDRTVSDYSQVQMKSKQEKDQLTSQVQNLHRVNEALNEEVEGGRQAQLDLIKVSAERDGLAEEVRQIQRQLELSKTTFRERESQLRTETAKVDSAMNQLQSKLSKSVTERIELQEAKAERDALWKDLQDARQMVATNQAELERRPQIAEPYGAANTQGATNPIDSVHELLSAAKSVNIQTSIAAKTEAEQAVEMRAENERLRSAIEQFTNIGDSIGTDGDKKDFDATQNQLEIEKNKSEEASTVKPSGLFSTARQRAASDEARPPWPQ